jgi:hypothetical protein
MNSNSAWWLPSKNQDTRREFQNEYIRREFGITLFSGMEEKKKQLMSSKNGEPALIFTDTSVSNFKCFSEFPSKSIVIFLLSDETYRLMTNIRLLMHPSTKIIIRDYPLGKIHNLLDLPIRLMPKIVRIVRKPNLYRMVPKAIFSGLYMIFAQCFISLFAKIMNKKIFGIPLGYDNGFGNIYAKEFGLEHDQSLISFALSRNLKINHKSRILSFMGQKGSADRQVMILEAKKISGTHIKLNKNYALGRNANNQIDFFTAMKDSKMSLNPPGNYSGHTFRFYEALLVGSLPIEDAFVISDPLYRSKLEVDWPKFRKIMKCSSNRELFLRLLQKSISRELESIKNRIDNLLFELDLNVS